MSFRRCLLVPSRAVEQPVQPQENSSVIKHAVKQLISVPPISAGICPFISPSPQAFLTKSHGYSPVLSESETFVMNKKKTFENVGRTVVSCDWNDLLSGEFPRERLDLELLVG